MDTQALKALIDLFGRAPLRELEISESGQTVKITRAKQAQAFVPPASSPLLRQQQPQHLRPLQRKQRLVLPKSSL